MLKRVTRCCTLVIPCLTSVKITIIKKYVHKAYSMLIMGYAKLLPALYLLVLDIHAELLTHLGCLSQ